MLDQPVFLDDVLYAKTSTEYPTGLRGIFRLRDQPVATATEPSQDVPSACWPNPVRSGIFFVQGEAGWRWSLYDFHGRLVLRGRLEGPLQRVAPPEPLAPGMYVLELVGESGRWTHRLVWLR